jgi:hypothetical protein
MAHRSHVTSICGPHHCTHHQPLEEHSNSRANGHNSSSERWHRSRPEGALLCCYQGINTAHLDKGPALAQCERVIAYAEVARERSLGPLAVVQCRGVCACTVVRPRRTAARFEQRLGPARTGRRNRLAERCARRATSLASLGIDSVGGGTQHASRVDARELGHQRRRCRFERARR